MICISIKVIKLKEKEVVRLYVPALIVLLENHENINRGSLTKSDVEEVVNKAIYMEVPPIIRENLAIKRGFTDVSPENAWAEWTEYKLLNGYRLDDSSS
jgi:hypothetical protein